MKTIRYLLSIAGMAMTLFSSCKKDATETTMQRTDASETSDIVKSVTFVYNGDSVTYGTIKSPTTGRVWLDRNLGAKQAATAYNDYQSYGDLFQWGRPDDGHQLIKWTSSIAGTPVNGTTTNFAHTDKPGTKKFILGPYVGPSWNDDWRDDNNRNRWNTKPHGPCPTGWHVPTRDEWAAEVYYLDQFGQPSGGTATSGGITKYSTAFSLLKLVEAGYHAGNDGAGNGPGTMNHPGEGGYYWASTDFYYGSGAPQGQQMGFNFTGATVSPPAGTAAKSQGMSVRCIKNL